MHFVLCNNRSELEQHAIEMMHMVACFKKLWKSDLKQAWFDYSLITRSRKPDKFMADDRFCERIVLLDKEKVRPSANASSDEFLREVVAMNMISLWKYREAVSRATGATSHGNCQGALGRIALTVARIEALRNPTCSGESNASQKKTPPPLPARSLDALT